MVSGEAAHGHCCLANIHCCSQIFIEGWRKGKGEWRRGRRHNVVSRPLLAASPGPVLRTINFGCGEHRISGPLRSRPPGASNRRYFCTICSFVLVSSCERCDSP